MSDRIGTGATLSIGHKGTIHATALAAGRRPLQPRSPSAYPQVSALSDVPLGSSDALQQPRLQKAQARLNEAAKLYISAVHQSRHELFDPEALGFEFTIEQIELRALDLQPDLFHDWAVDAEGERNAVA